MNISKPTFLGGSTTLGTHTATAIVKSGGTSSQFLKADGSIDSSVYLKTVGTVSSINVTEHSASNSDYAVVWNSGTALYKTASKLKWNPSLGRITATSFLKSGSSDSYFLLGDGSHTLRSGYSVSNHDHSTLYYTKAEVASLWGTKEDDLGNPASSGYVLSSTDSGVRSWIPSSGGVTSLIGLSDVSLATPTNKHALFGNGSTFASRALVEDDISNFGSYALSAHTHDYSSIFASITHTHDYSSIFASIDHTHDYSSIDHTHDYSSIFASITHTHDYSSIFASITHTHDYSGSFVGLTGNQTVAGIKTFTSNLNLLNASIVVTAGAVSAQGNFDSNGSFICNTSGGFKITGKTSDDILLADGSTTSLSAIGGMVYDVTTSTTYGFPFQIRNTTVNNPAYIGFLTTADQWACGADNTYFNILKYDSIGSASSSSYMRINYATGDTTFAFGDLIAVDHVNTSDRRIKKNIKDYNPKKINVRWREYDLKESGMHQIGVIADELEETNPEFVKKGETKEDMDSVRYMRLLIAKVAELEARLEKVE